MWMNRHLLLGAKEKRENCPNQMNKPGWLAVAVLVHFATFTRCQPHWCSQWVTTSQTFSRRSCPVTNSRIYPLKSSCAPKFLLQKLKTHILALGIIAPGIPPGLWAQKNKKTALIYCCSKSPSPCLLQIVVLRDISTHAWLLSSTGVLSVYRKRECLCVSQLWCKLTEQRVGNQAQWSTSKPKFNLELGVRAL